MLEAQRSESLAAMTQLIAEQGLAGVTVAAIAQRAFVSRAAFRKLFGSIEGCFMALIEEFTARVVATVTDAFAGEPSWRDSVVGALEALLDLFDAEPTLARLMLFDAAARPEVLAAQASTLVATTAKLLGPGPNMKTASERPPEALAEAVVVAVAGVIRIRLATGVAPPFMDLLPELSEIVTFPFLGSIEAQQAARSGAERADARGLPAPQSSAIARSSLPSALARANAHRARAVLLYLVKHPEASNKQIAHGIEIEHLGQTSVLLARLEKLGLLIKRAGGAGRPNAWRLSAEGERFAKQLAG